MKYLDPTFSVAQGRSRAARDGWERTFRPRIAVVINGVKVFLVVAASETVGSVLKRALAEVPEQHANQWQIQDTFGVSLLLEDTVDRAGIAHGAVLTLTRTIVP